MGECNFLDMCMKIDMYEGGKGESREKEFVEERRKIKEGQKVKKEDLNHQYVWK